MTCSRNVSFAGVAQLAERHLPKVNVMSSNLITRSSRHLLVSYAQPAFNEEPFFLVPIFEIAVHLLDKGPAIF